MRLRIAAGLALAALTTMLGAPGASAAPASVQDDPIATVYSGTVAPGGVQHRWWNNANPLSATYVLGLAPVGATTSADCQFEVTRTWYTQNFGGEREFHYNIKNIGSISCATNIHIYSLPDIAGAWNTNGVAPGGSVTKHWNNASASSAYVAGLSPNGATATTPCQFEVTREWYAQQPGGEKEFWFTITNVGTIACTAEVLLSHNAAGSTSVTGPLAPGGTAGSNWNNNPTPIAYLVGFSPSGATATTPCLYELTRTYYSQTINSGGTSEREFRHYWRNAGSITCSAVKLLTWL